MGLLSGNSCNIITILPMGLDCDSINASTPESTNGAVALYITGGTPPYKVTWDNGQQGTFLSNLSPGEYSATVIDYYGDFTGTTTCSVGFETFYLEEFENCSNGNKIYYLADLPSIFEPGSVYELTTQAGCWISSGLTLYSTQNYINSFAEMSEESPYEDCNTCDPPVTPIVYPSKLCLIYNIELTDTLTEFNSGNTINDYPSWTASSPDRVIYYNNLTTRWEISGWTQGGVPVFQNQSIPPVGTWSILGTYGRTLNVNEGSCPPPPLNLKISRNNPTCSNSSDGSIVVTPLGGVPPFTYSIDGINYQIGNTFVNLNASTYTIFVKDSNNTIASITTTLVAQQIFQNYTINLTNNGLTTLSGPPNTKTYSFTISVTPPLPNNKTLTFNLYNNVFLTGTTRNTGTPLGPISDQSSNISFTTNGSATISTPTTSSLITNIISQPSPCVVDSLTTTAYTENYQCTIAGNSTISGTITLYAYPFSITNIIDTGCRTFAVSKNSITVNEQNLTPLSCSYLNPVVGPLTFINESEKYQLSFYE
jgi:hypothetical protein